MSTIMGTCNIVERYRKVGLVSPLLWASDEEVTYIQTDLARSAGDQNPQNRREVITIDDEDGNNNQDDADASDSDATTVEENWEVMGPAALRTRGAGALKVIDAAMETEGSPSSHTASPGTVTLEDESLARSSARGFFNEPKSTTDGTSAPKGLNSDIRTRRPCTRCLKHQIKCDGDGNFCNACLKIVNWGCYCPEPHLGRFYPPRLQVAQDANSSNERTSDCARCVEFGLKCDGDESRCGTCVKEVVSLDKLWSYIEVDTQVSSKHQDTNDGIERCSYPDADLHPSLGL